MSQEQGRRPMMAGNWKCYKTAPETLNFINTFKDLLPDELTVDVVFAPPFPSLETAVKAAEGSPIQIASQNVFWEPEGAFTGEVSVGMLTAIGVNLAIIGHSERRQYFGETNETVNKRIKAALGGGVSPIFCIGESLEERESGKTLEVIENQVAGGLAGLDAAAVGKITLAYEPVWAIGTGKTATPDIAQKVHAFIRGLIEKNYDKPLAKAIRILYGGSVKPGNAADLMAQPDIDGALVGGASLKPDIFIGIVNYQ